MTLTNVSNYSKVCLRRQGLLNYGHDLYKTVVLGKPTIQY